MYRLNIAHKHKHDYCVHDLDMDFFMLNESRNIRHCKALENLKSCVSKIVMKGRTYSMQVMCGLENR